MNAMPRNPAQDNAKTTNKQGRGAACLVKVPQEINKVHVTVTAKNV
jgi:hypothetical protein